MRHKGFLGLLLFATLYCAAQTQTLYDNFDHRFLNQSLWYSVCAGFSVNEECATAVQDEKLHLARGLTGNTDSNTDSNGGTATVFFLNPVPIRSITTDMVVRAVNAIPCAANPGLSWANVGITARFFNAGDGTEADDVGAGIILGRSPSTPKGQMYVLASFFHNGDYSHTVSLGNVTIGTPVTVSVTWDQANRRFLFTWTNKITKVTIPALLSYSFSDTTPAADPEKHLDVQLAPANCTATQTWVFADAVFDNVYVSQ
jgi:hypothetical protein